LSQAFLPLAQPQERDSQVHANSVVFRIKLRSLLVFLDGFSPTAGLLQRAAPSLLSRTAIREF